jgi:antirestriction protein ArdC
MFDSYEEINKMILDQLDKGIIPWHRPWKVSGPAGLGLCNLSSKKPYTGFQNIVTLSSSPFGSNYWLTYKQAQSLGGQVRKGEKGRPIFFFKTIPVEDRKNPDKEKLIPFLRRSVVFNLEQIDGLDPPAVDPTDCVPFSPLEEAEKVVENFINKPTIRYDSTSRCLYSPTDDTVRMVAPERFHDVNGFYATLFHELTHSTGHQSRLDRDLKKDYAFEELVAELGSAYLAGYCGILGHKEVENKAAYIASWQKAIKDSKRGFIDACSKAKKAVNHILGTVILEATGTDG